MREEKNVFDVRAPKVIKNPVKAIRAKCLDCMANSKKSIDACETLWCPLWEFRFGKNPFRQKRELSQEQKNAAVERLKLARERKKRGNMDADTENAAK